MEVQMHSDLTTKLCRTCDEIKPLSEFNKNRSKHDGHASQCRNCTRLAGAAWRTANHDQYIEAIQKSKDKNPEKYRAMERAWATANPDRVQAARQRYADTHPYADTRRDYFRKRYQQHGQRLRLQHQQYQKANRAAGALKVRRYRALKGHKRIRGWPALRAWFGECCLCCGATRRIEADHVIPLAKGGTDTLANLQPLCRSCNASKATQTIDYRDPERFAAFLTSYSLAPTPPLCGTPPSVRPTGASQARP